MRWLGFILCGALLFVPAAARAQVGSGLMSSGGLQSHGLERMWFTQLDVNRARGRIVGVTQHVSSTRSHTVFEFQWDRRWQRFSERDLNAFGEMIGVEGAKKKAEEALAKIKADLVAAGKPETEVPQLATRVIPEIMLVATTDRGMIQVLDGETGKTRWSQIIGKPNYPMTEASMNDDFVAVCNGSTLYVFQASNGEVVWKRAVGGSPGAGPAMTDNLIYQPMVNGLVEVYYLDEPKRPAGFFHSFGRTMVQPAVSANSVAWTTEQGNLYVGFAHEPGLKFRVQAKDEVHSAPTFMSGGRLLMTSVDGYVYCIDEARGQIQWRFTTGEPITQPPVPIGTMIYAITDSGEMYAIDGDRAAENWLTSGIRQLLAGNEKRLYCSDATGNLAILDAKSGSRLGSIPAQGLNLRITNSQTDRILIGTASGLLQCIHERDLTWPMVHNQRETKAKGPAVKPTPAKPADGAAPAMPAGADPFAAPGEDPFGEKPGGAKPAPAADPFGAPAADPFGGAPKPASPPAADPFG
jgi:outer membrane protein assembly factor BamB